MSPEISNVIINPNEDAKIKQFFSETKSLIPNNNLAKIEIAITFSHRAHKDQRRLSGEPYFYHCLAAAEIVLLNINQDPVTIISALLHDVLEDTQITKTEIENIFGSDVANIVNQLTEIGNLPLKDPNCFVCRTDDIRVLYVKIADRLHNMRTLSFLPREKQLRVARTTLNVYAKIAGALNLGEIHQELENLAFKYWDRKSYETVKLLAKILGHRGEIIRNNVKRELLISLEKYQENHKNSISTFRIENIMSRDKSYYSAYNKMHRKEYYINIDEIGEKLFRLFKKDLDFIIKKQRETALLIDKETIRTSYDEIKTKYGIDLWEVIEKINDFTGMRIIVIAPTDLPEEQQENVAIADCYRILDVIRKKWPEIVYRDYIKNPKKDTNYKSIHITVTGPGGTPVEFHIHTQKMQVIAEQTHWYYKEKTREDFPWLQHLKRLKNNTANYEESTIYTFTPKGDYKKLPAGSTPVDFAYAVHSEVGNRCVSAKVNGKIVPLRTMLKTGDIVEIITGKTAKPSRDWLHFVHTSRARNKIQHYLRTVDSEQYIADGKETLIREMKSFHLNSAEVFKSEKFSDIYMSMGFSNSSDLLINIALGKVSPKQIVSKLIPQPEPMIEKPLTPKPGLTEEAVQSRDGIMVKGIQDVLIRFAKCCMPVPGDNVIGFITRGRGVSIHKKDCASIIPFLSDTRRIVNVDWDMDKLKKHLVPIKVEMRDRPGTLAAVLAEIANLNVNVYSSVVKKIKNNRGIGIITLEIMQLEQLNEILDRLRQIPNVLSVARTKRMK